MSKCTITRDTVEEMGQYTPTIRLETTVMLPCEASRLNSVTDGHCGLTSTLYGKREAGIYRRRVSSEDVRKSRAGRKKAKRKTSYKRKRKSWARGERIKSTRKKRVGVIETKKIIGARICDLKRQPLLERTTEKRALIVMFNLVSANSFHFYDSRTFQRACVDTGAKKSVVGLSQAPTYFKKTGNKIQKFRTGLRYGFGDGHRNWTGQVHVRIPIPGDMFLPHIVDVVDSDIHSSLGLRSLKLRSSRWTSWTTSSNESTRDGKSP